MFWPLGAKNLIKRIACQCVICSKAHPKSTQQTIGNLPISRVQLVHPFLNTGVDYAETFLIKVNRKTNMKAYIFLFFCMATNALNIELVAELSTKAFIAASTRFTSRSGNCLQLHSDNGTNSMGAVKWNE